MVYIIIIFLLCYIIYGKFLTKIQKFDSSKNEPAPVEKLPYKKKEYLFTNAEKSFYGVIKLILKDDPYSIFAKVRLCDLLYLPTGTDKRNIYWNKIKSKHIDFVICDDNHIKPVLAIELDDSSHNNSNRIERDTFVNKALRDAGLNIIRVKARNTYNMNELSQQIYSYINPVIISDEIVATNESLDENTISATSDITNTTEIIIPNCPKCGVPMIERTAKKGDRAGVKFYGCPNYPKCREVINI